MKLLSIDSSTKSTGYAVFEDGKLVTYKLLSFAEVNDTAARMRKMVGEIYNLIDAINPDLVVTEMTVVTRNAEVQRNLTIILGAIYGYCVSKDIRYCSLRPTEWRKLIDSGKKPRDREGLKIWSKKKVQELFGISLLSDDISDAILVGQAYLNKE